MNDLGDREARTCIFTLIRLSICTNVAGNADDPYVPLIAMTANLLLQERSTGLGELVHPGPKVLLALGKHVMDLTIGVAVLPIQLQHSDHQDRLAS